MQKQSFGPLGFYTHCGHVHFDLLEPKLHIRPVELDLQAGGLANGVLVVHLVLDVVLRHGDVLAVVLRRRVVVRVVVGRRQGRGVVCLLVLARAARTLARLGEVPDPLLGLVGLRTAVA